MTIRQFRIAFYLLWIVIAAGALGLFLVGSDLSVLVLLLVALAFGGLGVVEFERFARRSGSS